MSRRVEGRVASHESSGFRLGIKRALSVVQKQHLHYSLVTRFCIDRLTQGGTSLHLGVGDVASNGRRRVARTKKPGSRSVAVSLLTATAIAQICVVVAASKARVHDVPISIGLQQQMAARSPVVRDDIPTPFSAAADVPPAPAATAAEASRAVTEEEDEEYDEEPSSSDARDERNDVEEGKEEEEVVSQDFQDKVVYWASVIALAAASASVAGIVIGYVYMKMLGRRESAHRKHRKKGRLIPEEATSALPRSACQKRNRRR